MYPLQQPLQLILIIFLIYVYYKIYSSSKDLQISFGKRKDILGVQIATLCKVLALVCLPFIVIVTALYMLNYGIYSYSALFLSLAIAVVIIFGYSLLPHIYLKLVSAIKNNHSTLFAGIGIFQALIFLSIFYWFGSHFNRGHLTFRAIQVTALVMVLDALYELFFLFSRRTRMMTIAGFFITVLYGISFTYVPFDRIFVFNWNTVQSTPLMLGEYYLLSKCAINAVTALCLTSGVGKSVRAS